MKSSFYAFFSLLLLLSLKTKAQKHDMYPVVISFYNLENLYDTLDDPTKNDDDFTPAGNYKYNSTIYWDKLSRLSAVLSQIGTEISPDGPALQGVAEIENDTVLADLLK